MYFQSNVQDNTYAQKSATTACPVELLCDFLNLEQFGMLMHMHSFEQVVEGKGK